MEKYQSQFPEYVRELISAANVMIIGLDASGHVRLFNKAAERITGYTVEELTGVDWFEKIVPKDRYAYVWKMFEEYQQKTGALPAAFENPILTKTGEERFISWQNSPIQVSDGGISIISFGIDITERKQAEEELRESEAKYRRIVDTANEGIWVLGPDSMTVFVNARMAGMLGYSGEEMLGRPVADFLFEEDVPDHLRKMENRRRALSEHYERRFRSKDGKTVWTLASATPIFDEEHHFNGAFSMFTDITELRQAEEARLVERKKAEEALLLSQNRLEAVRRIGAMASSTLNLDEVLNHILAGTLEATGASVGMIFLKDTETGCLKWGASIGLSEAFVAAYRDQLIKPGEGLSGRIMQTGDVIYIAQDSSHDPRIARPVVEAEGLNTFIGVPIRAGAEIVGVMNILTRPPDALSEQETALVDAIGTHVGFTLRNAQLFAEWQKLEEQLRQSQKMEALGHLAGGVAHDFNNILTAIIGYGTLLKDKISADKVLHDYINQILAASEKAAALTQSLLAFSRKQIINLRPVNINDVVAGMQKILDRIIGEDIQFEVRTAAHDLIVKADRSQIEQVMMNLATNARDAMPRGGNLTVTTEEVEIDEQFIRTHQYGEAGRHAIISVSDTGVGMDKTTLEHIFEPFFTTKEAGKGTGLGLSMVYGTVKQHNGFFNVYSMPGQGTTVEIYLPLVKSDLPHEEETAVKAFAHGKEKLLLVEDDEAVRKVTRVMLEELGYTVLEAGDGAHAVKLFAENREEIQLVISDIIMPGQSGKDVYNALKQIKPDVKVLFISGYAADSLAQKGIVEEGISFISKPLRPDAFSRKLREVLDR